MLRTRTWDELVSLVEGYMGETLQSQQLGRLKALVNQAARRAYEECQYWPRFLVVGEPRTVERNYIQTSEDSFYVYGAGTSDVNGLYRRNGLANSRPKYTKYDSDGTTALANLELNISSQWIIGTIDTPELYLYDSDDATPPTSGWSVENGTSPVPLLVDVADIDQIIRVNKGEPYKQGIGRAEYFSITEGNGIRGVDFPSDLGVAYVTYRKVLSDTYGDGTGGTTSDIPAEWFDFIALYCARVMQVARRQSNPNAAYGIIAQAEVDEALYGALAKVDNAHIFDTLGKRVITHLNTNTQL